MVGTIGWKEIIFDTTLMLEYPYLLEEESYVSPCSVRDMDDLRVLDDCFPVTASESNTFAYLFYTIL